MPLRAVPVSVRMKSCRRLVPANGRSIQFEAAEGANNRGVFPLRFSFLNRQNNPCEYEVFWSVLRSKSRVEAADKEKGKRNAALYLPAHKRHLQSLDTDDVSTAP